MNLRKTLTILLLIACVAVYGIGLLLYGRNKTHMDNAELISHSHQVIIQAQNLYSSIERMTALQRGYLLSKKREFYTSYFDSTSYLQNEFETLKKLTHDNAAHQIRLEEIEKDITDLRQYLENRIRIRQRTPLHNLVDISPNMEEIRALADDIRRLVTEFISAEQGLLTLRQESAKEQELLYLYALFAVSILSMFSLVLANGLIFSLATRNRHVSETLNQSEKDLFKARERFELAMRGTSDGVFDWDSDTDTLYISPRFGAMLGYHDPAEFPHTGEEFRRLIHPEDLERAMASIEKSLQGGPDYSEELRVQHKDGSWRWHLARAATNVSPGEVATRIIGAHTDITAQKTIEENLRSSNKELEEFTYIASHDLRAPLVNLKGFASEIDFSFGIIKDFVLAHMPKKGNEKEQEVLEAVENDIPQAIHFIRTSVTKMEKLTRAILELSRVGRRRLEFEQLHTLTIVQNCIKSLQHEISTKNITVQVEELPNIRGDAIAIEQVFMNIIDNAVKYIDPNKDPIIHIDGKWGVSETIFAIRDNGRGIRKEDMGKIFEIFKRAGNNTDISGEGMGMAYVQAIIRRHGGKIWCESELGLGTTFYFSIPHHVEKGNEHV